MRIRRNRIEQEDKNRKLEEEEEEEEMNEDEEYKDIPKRMRKAKITHSGNYNKRKKNKKTREMKS